MVAEGLKRSRAQEKRLAKKTGGSINAGSGSGWKRRHDVRADGYLWEMKYTGAKQITIKADDLESVRKVAWAEGRIPLMGIELGGRNYVIMNEDDFLELAPDGG